MTDEFYDVQPSGYIQYGNTTTYNWNITKVDPHTGIEDSIYKPGDFVFESGFSIGFDVAPLDRGKFLGREGYHNGEKFYEDHWNTGFSVLTVGETTTIGENDKESTYLQVSVI